MEPQPERSTVAASPMSAWPATAISDRGSLGGAELATAVAVRATKHRRAVGFTGWQTATGDLEIPAIMLPQTRKRHSHPAWCRVAGYLHARDAYGCEAVANEADRGVFMPVATLRFVYGLAIQFIKTRPSADSNL